MPDNTIPDNAMIAVIGGTGLTEFQQGEVIASRQTAYGETSADLICSSIDNKSLVFLARHGNPHTIPPHKVNYRANLWALKQQGVKQIIAVNAVGGIAATMPAGCLVIPDQIIDYSYGREHSFYDGQCYGEGSLNGGAAGLEHVDFTYPFTERLRDALRQGAVNSSLEIVDGGVYGVTQGPRLETTAEINRMARDGCDIVGMTAMPEAGLARELGMDYASICLVVNPAAGRSEALITMDDIHRVIATGMGQVRSLLLATIELL